MPNKLRNMEITSIDLVEAGANQEAEITIVKGKENHMQDFETLLKEAIENDGTQLGKAVDSDTLKQIADDIVAVIRRRLGGSDESSDSESSSSSEKTQAKKGLVAEVVFPEETSEEEAVESEENEELEKSVDSEVYKSLLTKIEELQESNDSISKVNSELKKKIEMSELEDVAKKYSRIGYNVDELAKTLYGIKSKDAGIYDEFITVLDNSLNFEKSADIYKEIGTSLSNNGSVDIDTIVKGYVNDGEKISNAYEKALREHPELLNEYDEEYRG